MDEDETTAEVRAEIEALHVEFASRLTGRVDDMARIEASLAPEFSFVSPQGDVVERESLIEGLLEAHGARPDLKIEIKAVQVLHDGGDGLVAAYEEWHTHPTYETARQSTVVFVRDDDAPGGLAWLHVHECWKLPPPHRRVPPEA